MQWVLGGISRPEEEDGADLDGEKGGEPGEEILFVGPGRSEVRPAFSSLQFFFFFWLFVYRFCGKSDIDW